MAGTAGGVGVMAGLSEESVRAWVEATFRAQGVPVKVTDARVVSQVAALLTGRAGRTAPARSAGGAHRPGASQPPDRCDSTGVESAGTSRPGRNNRVVQDSAHDGMLAGEAELCP